MMQVAAADRLLRNSIDTNPTIELSIIVPAFNEQTNIGQAIQCLNQRAKRLVCHYEIIVVDDGSTDDTYDTASSLCPIVSSLMVLKLSRNFGKEQALMAGLNESRGDLVAIFDADLQEPVETLDTLLEHVNAGYDMAYATRASREDESSNKRFFTHLFYKLINHKTEVVIPPDARDCRLMTRRVVDALCALPERNRFMKGIYSWVGFKTVGVPIKVERRCGDNSKFGFLNLFKLGVTGITAFTTWPLRMWTFVGGLIAIGSILYGSFIALRTLFFGVEIAGWSTLVVAIFFLGGIQLISIGVLGEYISGIFKEVKGRPSYIISEKAGKEV